MNTLKYTKPERISLKSHTEFTEKWVQQRIAEDPSLLGLGDMILKDKEPPATKSGTAGYASARRRVRATVRS